GRAAGGAGGASSLMTPGACPPGSSGGSRFPGGASASVSPVSAWRCAAAVAGKSCASGPSRMLARRRAIEYLLSKLPVRLRGVTCGVVLEHRAALYRCLGIADRLADLRVEDEVAEVLLENLDGL